MFEIFDRHDLGDSLSFYTGVLPDRLRPDGSAFEALWLMRPKSFHKIRVAGREVDTPRWEQAYGVDYEYSGQLHTALPIPTVLCPLLSWVRRTVDERLNGILVNWYDGALKHHNGRHRDSTINVIKGAPFVIISLGEERAFRLRPLKGKGRIDFTARDGDVFILPFETNQAWTHEVPHFSRFKGRRISVTLRGFMTRW